MYVYARGRCRVGGIEERLKPVKDTLEAVELASGLKVGLYAVQIIS